MLATAAAGALTLSPADPAFAISGGRESVGIFKPLDDEDLSGESHASYIVAACQADFAVSRQIQARFGSGGQLEMSLQSKLLPSHNSTRLTRRHD